MSESYTRPMLDQSFRLVFRNFSTLFLAVAVVTISLHLLYSFIFKDVIALRELHPYIAELRPGRFVREVGAKDLATARTAFVLMTVLQIALVLPLMAVMSRILQVDAEGGIPSVVDGYLRLNQGWRGLRVRALRTQLPSLMGALAVALVVGILVERTGLLLTEPIGATFAWAAVGVAQGAARAVAAPFLLVPLVEAARPKRMAPGADRRRRLPNSVKVPSDNTSGVEESAKQASPEWRPR
jgi:hypothetical protein